MKAEDHAGLCDGAPFATANGALCLRRRRGMTRKEPRAARRDAYFVQGYIRSFMTTYIIAVLSICNISLSIGKFFGAIRIRDMSLSLSVSDRHFMYCQKNIGNHNRHASVYRLSLKN